MKHILICAGVVLCIGLGAFAADPDSPQCLEYYLSPQQRVISAAASPPGNTEVRMDRKKIVGAMVSGDTIYPLRDGITKFPIEFINRDSNAYIGGCAIRVISTDGATWAHPTATGGNVTPANAAPGIWIDTTGIYPKSDFLALYSFRDWGADGAGEDTVSLKLAANDPGSQRGIRPLDSGIFFYTIVRLKTQDIGKHICIDTSAEYPPSCVPHWSSYGYSGTPYSTYPTWQGRQCFTIGGCCRGLSGNYDCSPDDNVDISDVSAFVARYIDPQLPCCPGEANTDGSPDGLSDISDLSRLIDYLFISFTPPEPCQ